MYRLLAEPIVCTKISIAAPNWPIVSDSYYNNSTRVIFRLVALEKMSNRSGKFGLTAENHGISSQVIPKSGGHLVPPRPGERSAMNAAAVRTHSGVRYCHTVACASRQFHATRWRVSAAADSSAIGARHRRAIGVGSKELKELYGLNPTYSPHLPGHQGSRTPPGHQGNRLGCF